MALDRYPPPLSPSSYSLFRESLHSHILFSLHPLTLSRSSDYSPSTSDCSPSRTDRVPRTAVEGIRTCGPRPCRGRDHSPPAWGERGRAVSSVTQCTTYVRTYVHSRLPPHSSYVRSSNPYLLSLAPQPHTLEQTPQACNRSTSSKHPMVATPPNTQDA